MLELVRFTPGGISRADLARQLDLTRSTVSSIVAELVEVGLVRGLVPWVGARGLVPDTCSRFGVMRARFQVPVFQVPCVSVFQVPET